MKKRFLLFVLMVVFAAISKSVAFADVPTINFGDVSTYTVSDAVLFYDDGGPSGKYTYNTGGTMTFLPPEGKSLRMTFQNFYTDDNDHLYIYDGISTAGTLLADVHGFYWEMSDIPVVTSGSADGALTVAFDPQKNKKFLGWEILVEAVSSESLSINNIEVTPVNDLKMLRGSVNNKMLKVKVSFTGDQGTVNLTNLSFSALDTDNDVVTSAKLWYTGEKDKFDSYDLLGEVLLSDEMDFPVSLSFDKATEVYFWLTYDISPDAESGSKVQAQAVSLTTDKETVPVTGGTAVLTTVQDGIHGTFSIGTSGEYDFSSISSAVASLEPGIDGPVVFEIADGNYRELVTVPSIVGSSETNTITMRSATGNAEKVIITYDSYTNPGSANYDKRYGVFTFDGVSHFTLEDLTVTSGSYEGFPGIIFLRNASRHNSVKNCIVKSPASKDLANGTNLIYMYSKNEAHSNSDNFTLEGCTLDGGMIGVSLSGTSSTAYDKQTGGRIIGNKFMNQGSKAIYVAYEQNATVKNNIVKMGSLLASSYYALDLSNFGGNFEVSGNSIFMDTPIQSAVGIYLRSYTTDENTSARVFNNEINMLNVSSGVTGLRVNNDIPNLDIVHNTINITPKADTACAATGIFFGGHIRGGKMANNIVQNLTNGVVMQLNREEYAQNEGIPFASNIYYNSDPNKTIYIGGTGAGNIDFETWKTLGFDRDSFYEPVKFLSEEVLEPAEKGNLLNGTPIDYVTTDLYGASRDMEHPTIGAYEYVDSTGIPTLDSDYPIVKSVLADEAVIALKSSITAAVSYMVLPSSEEAPSIDDVAASTYMMNLRKGVEETVSITGLSPKTNYTFYAFLKSLGGLESEDLYKVDFTTTALPGVVEPLTVEITRNEEVRVNEGEEFQLEALADGGVSPYTFLWTGADGEELSNESAFTLKAEKTATYFVSVKDAEGNEAEARTVVLVTGQQYAATFEDLYLEPESNWHGYTNDPDYYKGNFYSGSFGFSNTYMSDWNSWNGFAYSNRTSTSFSSFLKDDCNSAVGHGADGSSNYGVAYVADMFGTTEMTLSNTTEEESVEGMWITNTAWVVDAILNGDGMEGKFGKNDWLKLTLTGLKADGSETESKDYYLADFRASDSRDRWYLDTWQWIDLSPLGEVSKIRFSIDSSKKNQWGITTPTYLCLDNVGTGPFVKTADLQTLAASQEDDYTPLELTQFFSFDPADASVAYSLWQPCEYASVDGSVLKVTAPADTDFSAVLKATQRGKNEYVNIPIQMSRTSGLTTFTAEGTSIYPNPASDHITVSCSTDNYMVEIYSAAGIKMVEVISRNGKERIDVSGLAVGTYVVRLTDLSTHESVTRKLIIMR